MAVEVPRAPAGCCLGVDSMSQERSELDREVAAQREVARIALAAVDGFALAGSGAIREHGVIERPTEDVDLFTESQTSRSSARPSTR